MTNEELIQDLLEEQTCFNPNWTQSRRDSWRERIDLRKKEILFRMQTPEQQAAYLGLVAAVKCFRDASTPGHVGWDKMKDALAKIEEAEKQ